MCRQQTKKLAVNRLRNVYSEPSGIYRGFEDVDVEHTEEHGAQRDFLFLNDS